MPTALFLLLLLLTLSSSTVTVFSARMESESGDRTCTKISNKNTNSYQQAWRQLQRSLHSNLTTLLILWLKAFVNGAILVLLILVESAVCINSTRQIQRKNCLCDMTMDWVNVSSCKTAAWSQEKKKKKKARAVGWLVQQERVSAVWDLLGPWEDGEVLLNTTNLSPVIFLKGPSSPSFSDLFYTAIPESSGTAPAAVH